MIAFTLALVLLSQDPNADIKRDCTKWDGAQPSQCEVTLADRLLDYAQALEGCALMHQQEEQKNAQLRELLARKPEPEEPDRLSLFGLPGWVTPVLAGVLVGGGVGIGLAL